MINAGVTVEKSLFFIDEQYVERYKEIANKLQSYYTLNLDGAIFNEDVWTTSFNIWLLLQPDDMLILESVEKTFYYSSNYIMYDFLKHDTHFAIIREHPSYTDELAFLFSIYLTNQLNNYWYTILEQNNLLKIAKHNQMRSYFDAHQEGYVGIDQFIEDQTQFLKALMYEIKQKTTLHAIVKDSCNEALHLYNKITNREMIR